MGPRLRSLYDNRELRFWVLQISGWFAYTFITFLSITLMDDNVTWPHVAHLIMSGMLGILITWPMRPLYHLAFRLPPWKVAILVSVSVLVLSGVWNILRVVIYAWWVGDKPVWDEFNHWYFGSLSIFLSWSVLYFGIKNYDMAMLEHQKLEEAAALRERERYRRLQAESEANEAQLKMLRYQLNPHFLFNTLNAIYALVRLRDNDKAGEMIQQLSQFLRHSLDQGDILSVPLDKELESLMLYLDIEQTRFEDRLRVELDVEPAAREAVVPVFILQPLIENAIKYAISPSETGGTVRIRAAIVGEDLELQVIDTGPGPGATRHSNGRGVGLQNTLRRLKTLYGENYYFETRDKDPRGMTVTLRFPYTTVSPLPRGDRARVSGPVEAGSSGRPEPAAPLVQAMGRARPDA